MSTEKPVSDTPETDGHERHCRSMGFTNPKWSYARTLERQRDEARREVDKLTNVVANIADTLAVFTDGKMPLAAFTLEEAKEVLQYMRGDRKEYFLNLVEKLIKERNQ